ncbi:chitinase 3 precursor, putative [Talaromyces stipitatus ATCC 10500]|uniref:chitinase n=1 Tax=Talaromyces stipitatus (strain ATCC 10500 / CBS 375.48 / QM 6759 / NRRL 1006) TaxID=441959 RepID=B8MG20_TALSN|nr:chitinase 3 precursor, putative [Talaromyces stipitatus ATCC 10500]EED15887.1 chitinase 3 precursor, putative [Talaromyces stipitatus ATCC 10500]
MIKSVLYTSALLAAFQGVQAGINLNSAQNIAVYWGQNSINLATGNTAQQRLSYYCENGPQVDTLILSFITRFNGEGGYPETNFANAGNNCTTFDGTQLLNCPQIADDIVTCQSLGKTILLSTGGGTYNEGGFSSEAEAVSAANLMWEVFGPVSSNSSVLRPFGTAVIDGFDFDFENLQMNNMPAYANQLRSLYSEDKSKTYYMTSAPQCVYPDYADGPMLAGAVYFDAIFVQFYNNGCGINSYVPGASTQWNFNFDVWDNWAKTVSLNPNVKVYIGVPGNTGAGSGYEPPATVGEVIDFVVSSGWTSFGGIMIWDASQVWANTGFLSSVYSYLPTGSGTTTPTSTRTTTTSKPTSTTSTTSSSTTLITTTTSKISTTTTSSTTTSTAPSTTCPVSGGHCSPNGVYACTGGSFGICDNGAWVIESCSTGQVCVQAGNGVYCDTAGSSDPVC